MYAAGLPNRFNADITGDGHRMESFARVNALAQKEVARDDFGFNESKFYNYRV